MPEPRPKERSFILRIPESYALELDGLVQRSNGKIKSRNDLLIDIIGTFLSELQKEAKKEVGENR